MPRRHKDPAADVLAYFETAELSVAKTVYALVDEVLRKRAPKTAAAPPKPRRTKPAAGPGPVSTVG